VAGAVVHELEPVEVEIGDDVADALAARGSRAHTEPALELGAVHETGKRVMTRLIDISRASPAAR
jgi:hypothetical protein